MIVTIVNENDPNCLVISLVPNSEEDQKVVDKLVALDSSKEETVIGSFGKGVEVKVPRPGAFTWDGTTQKVSNS
jgi:hypothetical protein